MRREGECEGRHIKAEEGRVRGRERQRVSEKGRRS